MDSASLSVRDEVLSLLRGSGFDCEPTPFGLIAATGEEQLENIGASCPTLAIVCDDSPVAPLFAHGVSDVAIWPRDRDALPSRVRNLAEALAWKAELDLCRAVLDGSPALLYAKTRAGQFALVNDSFAALYGVDRAQILGKYSVDLQPSAEARAAIDSAESRLLSSGTRQNFELRVQGQRGPRIARTSISLAPGPRSEQLVVGTCWDVTQETGALAALHRQHDLLRQVLDASPGPIFVKDSEGRFLLVNAALAALYGRTPEELLGSDASTLYDDPEEVARSAESEERALRARVPIFAECTFTKPDGESLRFLCVRCAFDDEDGERRVLTLATDITARRKAEANAEQYRAMVEMSRTLGLVTDLNGTILSASRAWLVALGHAEYTLAGTSLSDLLHPDDRARCLDGTGRRALDALDGAEVRCRAADGTYVLLSWSVAIDAPKGRGYAVAHDITDLRRAERSAEEARANAEEASRTKSRFLANMSHEVRTPMNGVLGMLEAALETDLSGSQREFLQDAHDSADALLVILNDILDISKIEAGKLELENVPFRIRDVVNAAVAPQFARAKRNGLTTRVSIDDRVPALVAGDPGRLRQILANLVGNAVKFTESGVISVSVRLDSKAESLVHVAVADTGMGIPPEKHARIFEPFRQADESTTRTHGGTGLGLSICRELTRLMGGRIWVDSEPGCGSTFHFTAALPEAKEAPLVTTLQPHPSAEPTDLAPLKVLLVEDNLVNTKLGVRLLNKNGCVVTTAPNGLAATEIAAREPFDLILMDLQMPIMDGFEATRRIRTYQHAARRIPIVALTASAMKDDEQRCLAADMDGHLSKPLEQGRLVAMLSRVRSCLPPRSKPGSASVPPPLAAPEEASVDLSLVRERCDNDRDLLREVVQAYRESCENGIGALQQSTSSNDLPAARRAAHQLRGAFLYVAARDAATLAGEIEHIDDANVSGLPSLVEKLKKEAYVVENVLLAESERKTAAPPPA